MKKRRLRVVLTSLAILALLAVLIFVTFRGSQSVQKVSEVKGNKDIVGVKIRLTGKIASKSLKSYADYYEFKVTDGKEEITVVYKGILPNSFQDGADIIADGYMQEDGKFKAKNLLVKCPSKYVPKERGGEESSVKIWYYVLIGLFLPLGLAIFLIKVITQKKRFFERK